LGSEEIYLKNGKQKILVLDDEKMIRWSLGEQKTASSR